MFCNVHVQVLKSLLALGKNELSVQIDGHDTLWGETGVFTWTCGQWCKNNPKWSLQRGELYVRVVWPLFLFMYLALSAAAGRGKLDECVFLLEQGAAITQPNRRGMTPIYTAVKHGHTQVRYLIRPLALGPRDRFPSQQSLSGCFCFVCVTNSYQLWKCVRPKPVYLNVLGFSSGYSNTL